MEADRLEPFGAELPGESQRALGMRPCRPEPAHCAKHVACREVGDDLRPVMPDPLRQRDRRLNRSKCAGEIVEVDFGMRDHAEIGHFDAPGAAGA